MTPYRTPDVPAAVPFTRFDAWLSRKLSRRPRVTTPGHRNVDIDFGSTTVLVDIDEARRFRDAVRAAIPGLDVPVQVVGAYGFQEDTYDEEPPVVPAGWVDAFLRDLDDALKVVEFETFQRTFVDPPERYTLRLGKRASG